MKKAILLFVVIAAPFIAAASPTGARALIRKDVSQASISSFGTCEIGEDGKVWVKNDGTQFLKSSTVDVTRIQNLLASLPSGRSAYETGELSESSDRRPEFRTAGFRRVNGKSETILIQSQGCVLDIKSKGRKCTERDGFIRNSSAQAQELIQIVNKACR